MQQHVQVTCQVYNSFHVSEGRNGSHCIDSGRLYIFNKKILTCFKPLARQSINIVDTIANNSTSWFTALFVMLTQMYSALLLHFKLIETNF